LHPDALAEEVHLIGDMDSQFPADDATDFLDGSGATDAADKQSASRSPAGGHRRP
jgi:hypothetical protein